MFVFICASLSLWLKLTTRKSGREKNYETSEKAARGPLPPARRRCANHPFFQDTRVNNQ
jgi:hypothetical protein